MLADAFEALVGAIYLDAGLKAATKFCIDVAEVHGLHAMSPVPQLCAVYICTQHVVVLHAAVFTQIFKGDHSRNSVAFLTVAYVTADLTFASHLQLSQNPSLGLRPSAHSPIVQKGSSGGACWPSELSSRDT